MTTRLCTEEAELYDIAFSWDLDEEAAWLIGRLAGPGVRTLLEPVCGSGRVLEAFAAVGIEAVGHRSLAAHGRARERAAREEGPAGRGSARGHGAPSTSAGRSTEPCARSTRWPVSTVRPTSSGICTPSRTTWRRAGSTVQLELRDHDEPWAGVAASSWIAEREGVRHRIDWTVREIDLDRGLEVQHSRIEVLSGPRQGEVLEETHLLAAWTPARWADAILRSPFSYSSTFDGDQAARLELPLGTPGRLLWHELVVGDS